MSPKIDLSKRFHDVNGFKGLPSLVAVWAEIRDELHRSPFGCLDIDRDGKTHDAVLAELTDHVKADGEYGWLRGWGDAGKSRAWTQLALVIRDRPIPFLGDAFRTTLTRIEAIGNVKVAAFVRLAPGGFLTTHRHPELRDEGLLQMHLTLDAAREGNYAYLSVEGEFRQHVPGEAFVFDGGRDHFALNASREDRTILYLEFAPDPIRARPPAAIKDEPDPGGD